MNVDAGDREAGFGKLDRERQADVAKSDDPDARVPLLDLCFKNSGCEGELGLHGSPCRINMIRRLS